MHALCIHNPIYEPCKSNHPDLQAKDLSEADLHRYALVLQEIRRWFADLIEHQLDGSCSSEDHDPYFFLIEKPEEFSLVFTAPIVHENFKRDLVSTYREYGQELPDLDNPLEITFCFPTDYRKLNLILEFNPRTMIMQYILADVVKLFALALPGLLCYKEKPNLADPGEFLPLLQWESNTIRFLVYEPPGLSDCFDVDLPLVSLINLQTRLGIAADPKLCDSALDQRCNGLESESLDLDQSSNGLVSENLDLDQSSESLDLDQSSSASDLSKQDSDLESTCCIVL